MTTKLREILNSDAQREMFEELDMLDCEAVCTDRSDGVTWMILDTGYRFFASNCGSDAWAYEDGGWRTFS